MYVSRLNFSRTLLPLSRRHGARNTIRAVAAPVYTSRCKSSVASLSAGNIEVKLADEKKSLPDLDGLGFGQIFSDHMLACEWNKEAGWLNPQILPYGPIPLDPAATSLHYGLEVFEGMKAYITSGGDGGIRMFRPDMNMKRLNNSAERLSLPTFDGDQLVECIKELLRVEKRWIPDRHGYSLYIRPTLISTHAYLGVGPPASALLYVICSPVGPYFAGGFQPVKLEATTVYNRAFPGGTGFAKCGGNYGPTIKPQVEAASRGYHQVMWLSETEEVTEVGTMNVFIFWINKATGEKELITAPLTDGTILPGVTRDSILRMTKDWGEFKVVEKNFTIHEVIEAQRENRLIEAFGAGTACIVCPIEQISYQQTDYKVPIDADLKAGKLTKRLADTIMGIQYGQISSEWSIEV